MVSGKYLPVLSAVILGIIFCHMGFDHAQWEMYSKDLIEIKELAQSMRDEKTGKKQPIQIFR